jgi:hypothetical protein
MVTLLDERSHCSSSSYALHMNVCTSHSHVFEALGADQLSRAMRRESARKIDQGLTQADVTVKCLSGAD